MPTTSSLQLPYPVITDAADVPRDIKALADKIDALSVLGPGEIKIWPVATPPDTWALCDGSVVDAGGNPQLAALLGSAGGFVTLPDFTDRFPAGAGPTNGAVGSVDGDATVALTTAQLAAHAHTTVASGAHDHTGAVGGVFGGAATMQHGHTATSGFNFMETTGTAGNINAQSGSGVLVTATQIGSTTAAAANTGPTGSSLDHQHGIVSDGSHSHTVNNTGSGTAHENRPPFVSVNFIIKLG